MTEKSAEAKPEYLTVINEGAGRWLQTGRLLGPHHLGPGWVKIQFPDGVALPFMLGETRNATTAEADFAERVERIVGMGLGYTARLAAGARLDEQERAAYAAEEARAWLAERQAARP